MNRRNFIASALLAVGAPILARAQEEEVKPSRVIRRDVFRDGTSVDFTWNGEFPLGKLRFLTEDRKRDTGWLEPEEQSILLPGLLAQLAAGEISVTCQATWPHLSASLPFVCHRATCARPFSRGYIIDRMDAFELLTDKKPKAMITSLKRALEIAGFHYGDEPKIFSSDDAGSARFEYQNMSCHGIHTYPRFEDPEEIILIG